LTGTCFNFERAIFGIVSRRAGLSAIAGHFCYLFHCYSIARDRLYDRWRLSACVSVIAPAVAAFHRIFMKLCMVIWDPKAKIEFVRGQNPIMPSPILPQFSSLLMHFQQIVHKLRR